MPAVPGGPRGGAVMDLRTGKWKVAGTPLFPPNYNAYVHSRGCPGQSTESSWCLFLFHGGNSLHGDTQLWTKTLQWVNLSKNNNLCWVLIQNTTCVESSLTIESAFYTNRNLHFGEVKIMRLLCAFYIQTKFLLQFLPKIMHHRWHINAIWYCAFIRLPNN